MKRATKKQTVMEQYSLALVEGDVVVHAVKVTVNKLPFTTKAELKFQLDRMAGWRPWDNWDHVINQLNRDRTYLITNGSQRSVEFINKGDANRNTKL